MRALAGVLAFALLTVACGDGDGTERPKESARPELTAEQIAAALDQLYPSPGQGKASYRAFVVHQSFDDNGTREESTYEETVIGDDHYAKFNDGLETLTYKGEDYLRRDSRSKWLTREEAGLSALDKYFDTLAGGIDADAEDAFNRFEFERLADELIGDNHALRVRLQYELDEDAIGIFIPDSLPTPDPNFSTPSVPDRADIQVDLWVDSDSLLPIRMGTEYVGYTGGREIQRTLEEWTYSDFNQVDELPVDLPG